MKKSNDIEIFENRERFFEVTHDRRSKMFERHNKTFLHKVIIRFNCNGKNSIRGRYRKVWILSSDFLQNFLMQIFSENACYLPHFVWLDFYASVLVNILICNNLLMHRFCAQYFGCNILPGVECNFFNKNSFLPVLLHIHTIFAWFLGFHVMQHMLCCITDATCLSKFTCII